MAVAKGGGVQGPDGRGGGQEADCRVPDVAGAVGQGEPDGPEGGDGRVHEG